MRRDIVRALKLIGEEKRVVAADGTLTLACPGGPRHVAAAQVAEMVREGLVERCRGAVARTAAGRLYLRRALAQGDEDAFAAQHRETVAITVGAEVVAANAAESPLAWLATRKDRDGRPMLEPAEYEAGRRLAADYERGRARARVTQSWDASGVRGGGGRDGLSVAEIAEDARRRTEAALAAVGPELASVLVAVCCEEIGLEAVEKRQRWPARSGKVVLRLALARLAAHYGIGVAAVGGLATGLVHWGSDDYRPRARNVAAAAGA